jgi:hypothetical protein
MAETVSFVRSEMLSTLLSRAERVSSFSVWVVVGRLSLLSNIFSNMASDIHQSYGLMRQTTEHARWSFSEAVAAILLRWPRELPVAYAGPDNDNILKVVARLRSTRYTNWLIVIDSIDDPDKGQLSRYVPAGGYGSILVTSTKLLSSAIR